MRRLDQPNFSLLLLLLLLFLGACWPCWLASPKQPGLCTLGQITAAMNGWIYCPALPGLCGWHDRMPSAVTGPPVGIAGCSRFCGCHVCALGVCGLLMARPRARAGEAVACVGLASQVEPNPQRRRLLRFLSHSPFLPTFFHFAVCLAPVQSAFASTSPFPPSPAPPNRLKSAISRTLDTVPTSSSLCAPACKQ